ncbi:TetR/AcrR family transcriptional regulator [Ureibacillus acetophenoni]|uniref:TetR family transcriptional regulator n=1 Tax=Ureibacillus acetophenoni TaxID=614649 RepID=A0A285UG05_9BACL|nr:TetR/AcrR family transcriptional regulator [Ureibacillus acetophenoni]SOC40769.1 TetR family transcriptional regulator [Ureibacillus acetophenoni]
MVRVGLDLNKIIQTAVEIADNEGLEAVTLASLARKLSVKSPSLFNHIKGLASLKSEMSLYGLRLLLEKLKISIEGKEQDEALSAMAYAYVEFTREHPGLYEITIQAPEEIDGELKKASDEIVELIIHVLKDYNLDHNNMIHTIRGLRSLLHGFSSLEQSGAFAMSISVEESFEFLIKNFIKSIHQINKESNIK